MTYTDIIQTVLRRNVSASQLAQNVNVTQSIISRLRNGDRSVHDLRLSTCEKFVKYYRELRRERRVKHNSSRVASVADVRDKLRNPLAYYVYFPDGTVKKTSHLQPEVHKLGYQKFVIKTPYYQLKYNHITYVLICKPDSWYLIVTPSLAVRLWLKKIVARLTEVQRRAVVRYVHAMQVEYQVGELNHRYCYIEIRNRSLQSAYYRLTMFELGYYNVLGFCLQEKSRAD